MSFDVDDVGSSTEAELPLGDARRPKKHVGPDIGIKCADSRKAALQDAAREHGMGLGPYLLLCGEHIAHKPGERCRLCVDDAVPLKKRRIHRNALQLDLFPDLEPQPCRRPI